MRLLFDENLSPKLVARLDSEFPGSKHVCDLSLSGCNDSALWDAALRLGLTIVSKDDDFSGLSVLRGFPPKVIWLVVGNLGTDGIERILRRHAHFIGQFCAHPTEALLVLRRRAED